MATNDGGSAFPHPGYHGIDGKFVDVPQVGMSLRDWFAGQAMCGLLASGHFTAPNDEEEGDGAWMTTHYLPEGEVYPLQRKFDFPEAAWRCADAMLRERNEKP